MRICYIADAVSIHTQRWVKYFADKGHEIHLISPSSEPFSGDNIGNVGLYVLKGVHPRIRIISGLINALSHMVQTRKLVNKIKPDILHAHYITWNGLLAAASGFHPLILTIWGSDIFIDPHRSLIHRYTVRLALKRADSVTSLSRYMNEYVQQAFNVSPNKFKSIPWGVELNVFRKGYPSEVQTLKKNLNINDDSFTVISPRGMSEKYGIEFIVKSIPHIIERYPNICFIFLTGSAVSTSYENQLRTIAENLGVKGCTRFVSQRLDREEMAIYYNMCDVLISIPRTDQFGSCIAEGMACGTIPIVGNLEVYRQYLTDGENAFFVDTENPKDIAEKVIHCIEHPELKERFYGINRKIVEEKLDWNKNAPRMEELYLSYHR